MTVEQAIGAKANGEARFDADGLISVVIPVYRSTESLAELVERLTDVFAKLGRRFEIVFVDDGSPAETWEILQQLHDQNRDLITAVQLMRNYGQHNALMCGFRHVRGDVVITMDDDLQNPPEEISKLLNALHAGNYDLVYGVAERKQHTSGRNFGSWVANTFYRRIFRTEVTVSAFRGIRRELVEAILAYNLNFTYLDGLLAWNTQRLGEVSVEHHSRQSGRSGYSVGRLVLLALNLFTNFSLLPLQVASGVGIVFALAGLATGAYYLVQAMLNNIAVPGYASIIIAVVTLGGLQLMALGIIGEYIGRMHMNVNRKPQYTIRQRLQGDACDQDKSGTSSVASQHSQQ